MSAPAIVGTVVAAWCGLAIALAAGWARIGRNLAPAPDAPQVWSDEAVRAEFDLLIPSMVTADSFALDASMNRRARGWAA